MKNDGGFEWEWDSSDSPPVLETPHPRAERDSFPRENSRLLTEPYRGPGGSTRVDAVRRALSAALEHFWRDGTLPSPTLLRDGLLVLEAGFPLDEAQRTLLARTALARDRGQLTALHHLHDEERVAGLLHEALTAGTLGSAGLQHLIRHDLESTEWLPRLAQALRGDLASTLPGLSARAAELLPIVEAAAAGETPIIVHTVSEPPFNRGGARFGAALLLLLAIGSVWFFRLRQPDLGDVTPVAAGTYSVTGEDGILAPVELAPFLIDRTEVTNEEYRACYGAGICNWPQNRASVTRPDYFVDPLYNRHPVIFVEWDAAARFCAWRGMRLPTAAEWEVAATWAPSTSRAYAWPWGDQDEPAFVISARTHDDTAEVGSRSPRGDSPIGLADMGGNVAEWTASESAVAPQMALVKGGSWRDGADALRGGPSRAVLKSSASDAIGFRCAADH